jgi:hypothetical protein
VVFAGKAAFDLAANYKKLVEKIGRIWSESSAKDWLLF